MGKLFIATEQEKEIIDITEKINKYLASQNITEGVICLFVLHTTCGLTTADLDPGTELDYLDALEKIAPRLKYRHSHNPSHFPDHFLSSLVGSSLVLPFENKKLILGNWQKVILIEFNGPRKREIIIKTFLSDQ